MQQSKSHRYSTTFRIARLIRNIFGLFCFAISLMQTQVFAGSATTHQSSANPSSCDFQIINVQIAQAPQQPDQVPQHGWEDVKLPDDWETRWKNYTGSAWYKIQWRYQCNQENQAWDSGSSCRCSDTGHRRQYALHKIGNEGAEAEFPLEAGAD